MSLSRKRKKELHKLQDKANKLWETQQTLVGEAASVAREARRQLGNYGREQVVPSVYETYGKYAGPYVSKSVGYSKRLLGDKIVPAAGAVVGSALSVWDVASDARARLASGKEIGPFDSDKFTKNAAKYGKDVAKVLSTKLALEPVKPRRSLGAGGIIAIILGVAAAAGVLYAAWQTLRADDELWVADDPLRAPDA